MRRRTEPREPRCVEHDALVPEGGRYRRAALAARVSRRAGEVRTEHHCTTSYGSNIIIQYYEIFRYGIIKYCTSLFNIVYCYVLLYILQSRYTPLITDNISDSYFQMCSEIILLYHIFFLITSLPASYMVPSAFVHTILPISYWFLRALRFIQSYATTGVRTLNHFISDLCYIPTELRTCARMCTVLLMIEYSPLCNNIIQPLFNYL